MTTENGPTPWVRRIAVGGLVLIALAGVAASFVMKKPDGFTLASVVAAGLVGFLKSDSEAD